jgi:hypothetical protein
MLTTYSIITFAPHLFTTLLFTPSSLPNSLHPISHHTSRCYTPHNLVLYTTQPATYTIRLTSSPLSQHHLRAVYFFKGKLMQRFLKTWQGHRCGLLLASCAATIGSVSKLVERICQIVWSTLQQTGGGKNNWRVIGNCHHFLFFR